MVGVRCPVKGSIPTAAGVGGVRGKGQGRHLHILLYTVFLLSPNRELQVYHIFQGKNRFLYFFFKPGDFFSFISLLNNGIKALTPFQNVLLVWFLDCKKPKPNQTNKTPKK